MRRVVMASANHWDSPVVTGSQQYARQFIRHDWTVAYLSDPISPFHLLRPVSWLYNRHKFGLWGRGGDWRMEGRLFSYNHLTLLPVYNAPLLRSRLAVRRSLDFAVPPLRRKLATASFDAPDLVWIDHLIFEGLLDRIDAAASVYRLADDPDLFPGPYPPRLRRRFPDLLERVDLVVATAGLLVDRAAAHRDGPVLYLPNGVDYPHFAVPGAPEPDDLAALPRPRALYVGSLEPWFDTPLLVRTARAWPRLQFVIVGPERIDLTPLKDLRNVHLLGPRPYDRVPAYMAHCDVGIIPFARTAAMQAVHPIKVYEYLAAGLPVVSTDWEELRRMDAPIVRAGAPADFVAAVGAAVEDPPDPDVLRAYARANSWEARFDRLAAALPTAP